MDTGDCLVSASWGQRCRPHYQLTLPSGSAFPCKFSASWPFSPTEWWIPKSSHTFHTNCLACGAPPPVLGKRSRVTYLLVAKTEMDLSSLQSPSGGHSGCLQVPAPSLHPCWWVGGGLLCRRAGLGLVGTWFARPGIIHHVPTCLSLTSQTPPHPPRAWDPASLSNGCTQRLLHKCL